MNVVEGNIVDIYLDGGRAKAKVQVKGAYVSVPLMLLMEARIGDRILIQSGIAVSRVDACEAREA